MPDAAELPHVDEHSLEIAATREATWHALLGAAGSWTSSWAARRMVGLLGCADAAESGPRPLAPGSAIPGFHVDLARAPEQLTLRGRHRFSDYALIFRLDELTGGGRTRLRAETRAEFPGPQGSAYRALVIGTRGHVIATRRILASVRQLAERG